MNCRQFYWYLVLIAIIAITRAQMLSNASETPTSAPITVNTTTEYSVTPSILEKWKNLEKMNKRLVSDAIKFVLPMLMRDQSLSSGISSSCMRDVMKLIGALRQTKTWAFSFIDASGKFIDGMLLGSVSALGDYDQCVAIKAINERRGKEYGTTMFTGKYCTLDIKPPLPPKRPFYKIDEPLKELENFSQGNTVIRETAKTAHFFYFLSLRFGICIPSGCNESDVSFVVNMLARHSGVTPKVRSCELKPEKHYTPSMIAVMTTMSFLGLLVLVGSLIDIYFYYTGRKVKGVAIEVPVAFSFFTNFRRLINTDVSNEDLSCLSGLRVLSITWIILGHTYLNINYQLFRQLRFTTGYAKDFAFTVIYNATVAVDTFFLMGGFLVCYLTLKIIRETKKPFSIVLYILHRLIRIMPIYSMVIAATFLVPLFGYGPVWHDTVDRYVKFCPTSWWTNFFFINNFYHVDQMCLSHTWYVASDMQLHIAALLVLLPLLRWPKIGLSIAGLGIAASMATCASITYIMDYPPTMLFIHPDIDQRRNYWSTFYFKPYTHMGPYCVGMLLGYLLATYPKQLSLRKRILGWGLAISCNLAVLYGVYGWNNGRDPTTFETLLYSSCHRVGWAMGVSWVIYNCAIGQGGVVHYILSWKCWTVLARLTYGAYLIHPLVQITSVGNLRIQIQPWQYFAVWMYFGHLCVTYGCSFVVTMLVEAPFMALEKIIFRKQLKSIQKETDIAANREDIRDGENDETKVAAFPNMHTKTQNDYRKVHRNGLRNESFLNDNSEISKL